MLHVRGILLAPDGLFVFPPGVTFPVLSGVRDTTIEYGQVWTYKMVEAWGPDRFRRRKVAYTHLLAQLAGGAPSHKHGQYRLESPHFDQSVEAFAKKATCGSDRRKWGERRTSRKTNQVYAHGHQGRGRRAELDRRGKMYLKHNVWLEVEVGCEGVQQANMIPGNKDGEHRCVNMAWEVRQGHHGTGERRKRGTGNVIVLPLLLWWSCGNENGSSQRQRRRAVQNGGSCKARTSRSCCCGL